MMNAPFGKRGNAMKIWMNGEMTAREAARLDVFDHGALYGDGVFEGIRAYGGRAFKLGEHIDRLYESAKYIRLAVPYTKQELSDAVARTLEANGIEDGYVRLVVTRGAGTLGLNPFKCPKPTVFIIADPIALYPKEMYEEGMAVIVAKTVRTSARSLPPWVKSLNYLNNILAKIEAVDAGVAEAIMLNGSGRVAECTGDNLFIVEKGRVLTPPADAGILIGITRAVVMRLAADIGMETAEEEVSVERLHAADECFLTGTAAEVIAVTKIDGRPVGDGSVGPVTRKFLTAFRKYVGSAEW